VGLHQRVAWGASSSSDLVEAPFEPFDCTTQVRLNPGAELRYPNEGEGSLKPLCYGPKKSPARLPKPHEGNYFLDYGDAVLPARANSAIPYTSIISHSPSRLIMINRAAG
jgi:hypothetical protein